MGIIENNIYLIAMIGTGLKQFPKDSNFHVVDVPIVQVIVQIISKTIKRKRCVMLMQYITIVS